MQRHATEGRRAAASDRVVQLAHADHRRLALVRYGRNRNNVKVVAVGHDLLRGDRCDRVHAGIVVQGEDLIGRWVNRIGEIIAGSDRV